MARLGYAWASMAAPTVSEWALGIEGLGQDDGAGPAWPFAQVLHLTPEQSSRKKVLAPAQENLRFMERWGM